MGNEEVKQNEMKNKAEDIQEYNGSPYFSRIVRFVFPKARARDYLTIAFRLAREKLSPIGSCISWAVGIFGVLVSPEHYRFPLVIILVVTGTAFFAYMMRQYNKLKKSVSIFLCKTGRRVIFIL